MHIGPNIVDGGLVFGYDTGYGVADNSTATRFYPGEPSVNLFGDVSKANARPNRTEYNTSNWTASFQKPPENVGRVYSHTSGSLNSTWSGNSYGYTLIGYSFLANISYTLSCWVYVSSDCNITAMHQSMEGTTLTNTANRWYDLNKKGTWQQLSITCNSSSAVNGNAIIAYPSRSGVTDGSHTGFWAIGGAKLEINTHVTPYVLGTRSSTASLIDLKETANINITNLSFDATGQPIFDGTDDYIDTNQTPPALGIHNSSYTMEAVFKLNTTSGDNMVFGTNQTSQFNGLHNGVRSGVFYHAHYSADRNAGTALADTWYHVAWVHTGSESIMYVNGSPINSLAQQGAFTGTSNVWIGRHWGWFNGQIPIAKVYNRALAAEEIQQNFKAYKNRFNL